MDEIEGEKRDLAERNREKRGNLRKTPLKRNRAIVVRKERKYDEPTLAIEKRD